MKKPTEQVRGSEFVSTREIFMIVHEGGSDCFQSVRMKFISQIPLRPKVGGFKVLHGNCYRDRDDREVTE